MDLLPRSRRMIPTFLISLVYVCLLAACTILPSTPAGDFQTVPGEPVVAFGGEPLVTGETPSETSTSAESLATSPLATATSSLSTRALPTQVPVSTTLAPTIAEQQIAAGDTTTPANVEEIATVASEATPALEELLELPVETSAPRPGLGLAAAASGSTSVAQTDESPTALPVAEILTGTEAFTGTEEAGPLLVPVVQPLAPSATPTVGESPRQPIVNVTPDGEERTLQVPILMYHYLSTPPDNADIYRRDLSVSPDLFAQHLDRMQAEGYTSISLYTFMQAIATGASLPEKPVVITFDDGYRDNYTNAFPALHDRGMTATFFVVSDFMDAERPEYMTWKMAREMLAGGMSIESHGRNHASLEGRDDDYLVWQALGSMETIEFELGVRPRFVAYPAGEYDDATGRIFASAGYWAGMTTQQGATHSSDNLFELTRVRMRGTTSPDELIRLLRLEW